jgi:hypothetical protein
MYESIERRSGPPLFQGPRGSYFCCRIRKILHPGALQYEFPSRLNPNGKGREKDELLADYERGLSIISKQEYRIKSMVSDGDRVCVEMEWKGEPEIPIGALRVGDAMRADFGVFFRIADGMILGQNNYDCIHPW